MTLKRRLGQKAANKGLFDSGSSTREWESDEFSVYRKDFNPKSRSSIIVLT